QAKKLATPKPRVERQEYHRREMIAVRVSLKRRQFNIPSGTPPRIPLASCDFELGIPLGQDVSEAGFFLSEEITNIPGRVDLKRLQGLKRMRHKNIPQDCLAQDRVQHSKIAVDGALGFAAFPLVCTPLVNEPGGNLRHGTLEQLRKIRLQPLEHLNTPALFR